jgi:hypothetical protein
MAASTDGAVAATIGHDLSSSPPGGIRAQQRRAARRKS